MMNIALQQLLQQLPPTLEVEVFIDGKVAPIEKVYAGNKRYIPRYREIELKTGKMFSDSIIIECTKE